MLKRLLAAATLLLLSTNAAFAQDGADLDAIKTYTLDKAAELQAAAADLLGAAQAYYDLAAAAEFDYEALWAAEPEAVSDAILAAKDAWIAASPLYEQMEGIVAGVPVLSVYDVILDAGVSAEEDPESATPYDLTLPDGTVLEQPGNVFGLLESTLWGTRAEFSSGLEADIDGSGAVDFGELLPDANMLLGTAQALDGFAAELITSAEEWQPTEADAFTALVVMVPTMSEYFESWKNSRFVAGEDSEQAEFVVISRLSDIQDILGGLQIVYENVSPLVVEQDAALHEQIDSGLTNLRDYVADLYTQELDGRQFSPEEADFFGSEAQDRAASITGQIAQVAGLLNIDLPE
jgi:hypothetical protein